MMTTGAVSRALRLLAPAAMGAALMAVGPATAGPATYDRETRSFRLTYTFADLPGAGIGDRVPIVGANQKPTAEEEATIKALTAQVSNVLLQATEGRAGIGRLDYIDDIKGADIVVSRTGKPSSAGWAVRGAIDNRPGYLVLYYQTLVPFIKQDVVYTATHELCHYAFGLVDEYQPNLPQGCPTRPGAACLMDNYFSSMRGYMGRFCNDTEHVPSATQPTSCQRVVDRFFDSRGVSRGGSGVLANTETVPDPRDQIVQTVLGKVRARREEMAGSKKPGSSTSSNGGTLRTFATKALKELVEDFNRNNPKKAIFTPAKITEAVKLIVNVGTFVATGKPPGLEDAVFNMIRAEAKRLGQKFAADKTEQGRASKIRAQLTQFVGGLAKENAFGTPDFPRDQQRSLIESLAREEARGEQDKALTRLVGINELGIQLDREIAENIVDVLDEMGAPGIVSRRQQLRRYDEQLKKLSIPGRTSATFGRRRTRFINPDPVDSLKDGLVLTQGGVFPYSAVRDRGFQEFSRLINRERIELVEPRFSPETLVEGGQPLDVRVERPFEGAQTSNLDRIRAQRNTNFQAMLNDLYDQIQRDRLENVAILVPPGGLPPNVSQALDTLRAKLPQDSDVRLDIVLVGPTKIPTTLRDLAVRSRGSVLTINDLDEVGTIAQRLKNEQTSGSWVIIPQRGTIPQGRPFPEPDRLAAMIAAAQNYRIDLDAKPIVEKPFEVEKTLTDARGFLARLSRQNVTKTTGAQIDEARARIEQISFLFNKIKDELGNYDRLSTARAAGKVPANLEDLRRTTSVLILDIASLKTEIEGVKTLISASRLFPLTEEEEKKLKGDVPQMEAETLLSGLSRIGVTFRLWGGLEIPVADPSRQLKDRIRRYQNEDQLGRNLSNLDDLVRQLEKIAGAALEATKDSTPIFQRIDRKAMDIIRRQAEAEANVHKSNPILDRTDDRPESQRIRLARFYVEKDAVNPEADLELILGLSRPLPEVDLAVAPPILELLDDSGALVAVTGSKGGGEDILFDDSTSTNTCLVYRIQAPRGLPEQAYTPFLRVEAKTVEGLRKKDLNFTFSVGSTRRNVQLLAGLVDDTSDNTRGTLRSTDRRSVIEVNVSAGSAVLGAKVVGFYERLVPGSDPIPAQRVDFEDKGQVVRSALGDQPEIRDKAAGDGIYTASIPIGGEREGAEYRVIIQADTTDGKARYIPLDDPNRGDPKKNDPSIRTDQAQADAAKASQEAAEGTALRFQRATSVHFRVEP